MDGAEQIAERDDAGGKASAEEERRKEMIAYASRTGTRRNLDALRGAGWRLMVSATGAHRTEGFPYAIDNGAWTAFSAGTPWDQGAFEKIVASLGAEADFIVAPDIVAGGLASLRLSESWLARLDGIGRRRLVPVQDGMSTADARPIIGAEVGRWADLARERGSYCHVGRVNTGIRIRMCGRFGVDSFDGSSVSRFAETLPELEAARAFWTAQRSMIH